ncbi:MAG: hypothetical protein ACM3KS_00260, partial [Phycisphaerales bacterium]
MTVGWIWPLQGMVYSGFFHLLPRLTHACTQGLNLQEPVVLLALEAILKMKIPHGGLDVVMSH